MKKLIFILSLLLVSISVISAQKTITIEESKLKQIITEEVQKQLQLAVKTAVDEAVAVAVKEKEKEIADLNGKIAKNVISIAEATANNNSLKELLKVSEEGKLLLGIGVGVAGVVVGTVIGILVDQNIKK